MRQVLDEAGKWVGDGGGPCRAVVMKAGAQFEAGSVTTPPGFAYSISGSGRPAGLRWPVRRRWRARDRPADWRACFMNG